MVTIYTTVSKTKKNRVKYLYTPYALPRNRHNFPLPGQNRLSLSFFPLQRIFLFLFFFSLLARRQTTNLSTIHHADVKRFSYHIRFRALYSRVYMIKKRAGKLNTYTSASVWCRIIYFQFRK